MVFFGVSLDTAGFRVEDIGVFTLFNDSIIIARPQQATYGGSCDQWSAKV